MVRRLCFFYSIVVFSLFSTMFVSCENKVPVNPNLPQSYLSHFLNLPNDVKNTYAGSNKIIIYYDLKQCLSCQTKEFSYWDDFLLSLGMIAAPSNNQFQVILVCNVAESPDISEFVDVMKAVYPIIVYYDSNEELRRNNTLPKNNQYNCFLLDKKNRILLIGKPIFNEVLFDKYLTKVKEFCNE